MTEQFDVVVVGLGAIGSATCHALARAGVSVLGLEQFDLGHARGASHDHSRIIRRSYHTPGYVTLTGDAYDAWDRVESDEPLVIRTGGVDLFPADAAIPIDDYTRSMDAVGVPFELLDAAEIMARWPAWHLAPDVRRAVPGGHRHRRRGARHVGAPAIGARARRRAARGDCGALGR